jgi:hypothetical protein
MEVHTKHTGHNSAQLQFPLILYHLSSSLLIFSSLVYPFFWLCSRFTHGSVKSSGQHCLYSLQLFSQSVSSDVEPSWIFSLAELSWVLEFLLIHPYRANLAGMRFSNLWCSSTQGGLPRCCIVWRGWEFSQYSIKTWNFEIELTFYLLGLSNFNIHSLVHKHLGRLLSIIAQRQGRSENLNPKIPSPNCSCLTIGGNKHLNICLSFQAISSGGPDQCWNPLQNTLFRPEQITLLDSGLLPLWSLTLQRTEVGEQR